jgi:hypothetical protein
VHINSFALKSNNSFPFLLVLLSSVLLGIWAVKETIALRNILLVVGSLSSIYYITQEFKQGTLKEECDLWRILTILLLGLTFIWVLAHFLFFSVDTFQQLKELKSTWLRAFMAALVGLATGLALRNHPNRLNLLWLGIFVAFVVLFYQYIPRAIAQNKLLVPDYDYYLFHMKINTVLMGMVLSAGTYGALIDHLAANWFRVSCYLRFWYLLYWFLSTSLLLWAFTYIVNARNGIALAIILYSIGFIFLSSIYLRHASLILDSK